MLGKFARVALGTKNIDYNGRLCMVSAGTAYRLTFGIDRATNPWTDLAAADLVIIAGSNTAECAPITTHYLWQCRERGGRLIVIDPRMTRSREMRSVSAGETGTDLALFLAMLHVLVRGRLDEAGVPRRAHDRLRRGARLGKGVDARTGRADHRRSGCEYREGSALDRRDRSSHGNPRAWD